MANHIVHFDTFTDFLRAVDAPSKGILDSSQGRGDSWAGASYSVARSLASNGWPEGRRLVEEQSARIVARLAKSVHRPEVSYDVVGDCFDMGRVVTGEPENAMQWTQSEATAHGPKIHNIVVNYVASASYTAEQLQRRGIAIAALVDALEYCDYRVGVTVAYGVQASFGDVCASVQVKEPSEPMQMDKLAFVLGHPAMLRRIGFKYMEANLTEEQQRVFSGYGVPANNALPQGDIVIGGARSDRDMLDNPEKWVVEQLKAQGIQVDALPSQDAPFKAPNAPQNDNPKCKRCGGPTAKRSGPYGEFYGCKAYPRCKGKG